MQRITPRGPGQTRYSRSISTGDGRMRGRQRGLISWTSLLRTTGFCSRSSDRRRKLSRGSLGCLSFRCWEKGIEPHRSQNILGVYEQAQGCGTSKGVARKGEGKSKTVQDCGVGFKSPWNVILKHLSEAGCFLSKRSWWIWEISLGRRSENCHKFRFLV